MTTRRNFLVLAAGAAAAQALAQVPPNIAAVRRDTRAEAVGQIIGGEAISPGEVKPHVPLLIDTGSSGPVTVSVDSPMAVADHVKAIYRFTEKKPQPNVVWATLGPPSGRATLSTRARIADTGVVMAVA